MEEVPIPLPTRPGVSDPNPALRALVGILEAHRGRGEQVLLCLAGSDSGLHGTAVLAAYLTGCDRLYQVLTNDEVARPGTGRGFAPPDGFSALLRLPVIDLGPVVNSVLPSEPAPGPKTLSSSIGEADVGDLMERCSRELSAILAIRRLRTEYERHQGAFQRMCNVVDSILLARASEQGLMPPQQQSRVKTFDSLWRKFERRLAQAASPEARERLLANPFDFIRDVAAARVVCYFPEDADVLVGIIRSGEDFEILEDEAKRKKRGYRGHHFKVRLAPRRAELLEYRDLADVVCEIQVKTIYDHAWSEVEHKLRYKSADYEVMRPPSRAKVDGAFQRTGDLLNAAKRSMSRLRRIYRARPRA